MKKAIFLVVFLLGASYLGFSQEKSNISRLTSGKWKVKTMQIGNEKLELSGDVYWMVFRADGIYEIKLEDKAQQGTWMLSDNKKDIKFDSENFDGSSTIKKLTDEEFLFSISQGEVVYNMTLKK